MAQTGLHDLSLERALLAEGYEFVIGIDEVGRGALAGPVSVGVALFDLMQLTRAEVPEGIHDSKQLSALSRQAATDRVSGWASAVAVGSTTPQELDELGMTMALNLAGRRALSEMLTPLVGSLTFPPLTMMLLDGKHDWLSAPLTLDCLGIFGTAADLDLPHVRTVIKGDGSVPVIAAASIVAKVQRDETMIALAEAHPQYGWESNVGYGTAKHRRGIADFGPSIHHRRSFRLQTAHDAKEGSS